MRRMGSICLLGALLCLLLSGCGYRELHQRVLVQGLGVDKTSQGYRVTLRAAGEQEGDEDALYTCQGTTVGAALSSLSLTTGREPFYAHNALVVLGSSCGEAGVEEVLDFLLRCHGFRPGVPVYLSQGSAQEILSAQGDSGFLPIGELQALGESGAYNGLAAAVDLLDLVNSGERPGSSPVLPVLGLGEDRVEVVGTAYLQDYRWAGTLSLEETRGFLAITGDLTGGELTVDCPGYGTVTLTITQGKTVHKVDLEANGSPAFQTSCTLTGDLAALPSGVVPDEAFYLQVEEAASRQLQGEMAAAWNHALAEDGCDIFGFGNRLSQKYPQRWEVLDWDASMGRCQYQLRGEVTVTRMEQPGLTAG